MEEFLLFKPTFISIEKVTKYIRIMYKVGNIILFLNEQGDVDQIKFSENPLIEDKIRKILKNTSTYPYMLLSIKKENVCNFIELISKNKKGVYITACAFPDKSNEMYEIKFKNTLIPLI